MTTVPAPTATYDELYRARRAARRVANDPTTSADARRAASEVVHAATGLLYAMRRDAKLAAAQAAQDAAEAARDAELAETATDYVRRTAAEELDVETCEHGLAAWLCEGPQHYPYTGDEPGARY